MMTPLEHICPSCSPAHVLQPNERLGYHGPACGRAPSARADKLDQERIGTAIGNRRFDSNDARADMLIELAKLDPRFNASGRSDDYLRGRLDDARERAALSASQIDVDAIVAAARHGAAQAWRPESQRTDSSSEIDVDAIAAAGRHRNAEAWKPEEQRTDAASKVDPDQARARMIKRNEEAWKGKSGVDLLKQLEDETDKERTGPVGMR